MMIVSRCHSHRGRLLSVLRIFRAKLEMLPISIRVEAEEVYAAVVQAF